MTDNNGAHFFSKTIIRNQQQVVACGKCGKILTMLEVCELLDALQAVTDGHEQMVTLTKCGRRPLFTNIDPIKRGRRVI